MTHEHLEFHRTVEQYWRAKAVLVERVAEVGGVVVLNADDPGAMSAMAFAKGAALIRTSAAGKPVEISASDVSIRGNGTSFVVHADGRRANVEMPLIGGFNIDNALIAIGVAQAAGVDLMPAVEALTSAQGVPGRMQLIDEGQPFSVVVDYAHTPESLRKILTLLREIQQGRVIVVSGSAGERDPSKRPMQGEVCAELADLSIFTNEDPRNEDPERILEQIAEGARRQGGIEGDTFHKVVDRREAIERAFALAQSRAISCCWPARAMSRASSSATTTSPGTKQQSRGNCCESDIRSNRRGTPCGFPWCFRQIKREGTYPARPAFPYRIAQCRCPG